MSQTLWMFPGQGSQTLGMGAELAELPQAAETLALAQEILGWSVPEVCQTDAERLGQTRYTQPCLYVVEALLVQALQAQGQQPDYLAGHSLGEYVALYAAGVFDFATGLQLVQRRAELMQAASGGQMAALIGFDRQELTAKLAATEGVVLANDNSDAQVVISGEPAAVQMILDNVKAKRAVPLAVSGAFHSPFMADAAAEFNAILEATPFGEVIAPVLSNTDPTPSRDPVQLKARLAAQMTGTVRWRETMAWLKENGCDRAVEIGPGKVLTGLLKRACPQAKLENFDRVGAG